MTATYADRTAPRRPPIGAVVVLMRDHGPDYEFELYDQTYVVARVRSTIEGTEYRVTEVRRG